MITSFSGKYRFLSNFSGLLPSGKTVEHHYQAAKTLDPKWQQRILAASSPGTAKKLGRQAPLRPDWEIVRIDVMRRLVKWKFSQKPYEIMLLGTGNQELVEGNSWNDTFWGVCKGKGENWLGKILMEIREDIKRK